MVASPLTMMKAEKRIPIWKSSTRNAFSIWFELPRTMYWSTLSIITASPRTHIGHVPTRAILPAVPLTGRGISESWSRPAREERTTNLRRRPRPVTAGWSGVTDPPTASRAADVLEIDLGAGQRSSGAGRGRLAGSAGRMEILDGLGQGFGTGARGKQLGIAGVVPFHPRHQRGEGDGGDAHEHDEQ